MKVLYICRLFSGLEVSLSTGRWLPTGAPTIYKMIEALDRSSRHHPRIILTTKGNSPEGLGERIATDSEIRVEGLRHPLVVLAGDARWPSVLGRWRTHLSDFAQSLRILREYRRFKPDIVYVDRGNIVVGALFAWMGARVILRIMGIYPEMWHIASSWRPSLVLQRWAFRAPFAQVICTRDGTDGESWMQAMLSPVVPRCMSLNGVDSDTHDHEVEATLARLPKGRTIVSFVGRLEDIKGCSQFLDAAAVMAETHRDRMHFVVTGTGSLAEQLRKRAHEASIGDFVTFIDRIPHRKIGQLHALTDIYVSLNKLGNLSNANLEVMRRGLCMVFPESDPVTGADRDIDSLLPQNAVRRVSRQNMVRDLVATLAFLEARPDERQRMASAVRDAGARFIQSWEGRVDWEVGILDRVTTGIRADIVLVLSDMGRGGTQRVVSLLANAWIATGKTVAVVTLAGSDADAYPMDNGVIRIGGSLVDEASGVLIGIWANLRRILWLRRVLKAIGSPVAIGFIAPTNVLLILAAAGLKRRVVISERNDPARQSFGRPWDALRRLLYRHADLVTANSKGAITSLSDYVPANRLRYLRNPMSRPKSIEPYCFAAPTILAVGRLHAQKAYDVLLQAFAEMHTDCSDWRLAIVGSGGLEAELRSLADRLSITPYVDWLGQTDDPYPYYAGCEIFALASRHEGMPNVLLEAMSMGKAVVVSDCSPGPIEIVDDGITGLTVPCGNAHALAGALRDLALQPERRMALGAAAAEWSNDQSDVIVHRLWSEAAWPSEG